MFIELAVHGYQAAVSVRDTGELNSIKDTGWGVALSSNSCWVLVDLAKVRIRLKVVL